jgi:hypothetical protein
MADAAHPELHQPSADVAEKSAGRARDVPVKDANRRSALPAALAAEPPAAEPCTPDAAQFVERSCAAPEAQKQMQMEERPDARQPVPQAEHSLKPLAELLQPEPALLAVGSPGAQARSPATMKSAEASPRAEEQLGPPAAQPPMLPEASPPVSPPVAQQPQASLPEHA